MPRAPPVTTQVPPWGRSAAAAPAAQRQANLMASALGVTDFDISIAAPDFGRVAGQHCAWARASSWQRLSATASCDAAGAKSTTFTCGPRRFRATPSMNTALSRPVRAPPSVRTKSPRCRSRLPKPWPRGWAGLNKEVLEARATTTADRRHRGAASGDRNWRRRGLRLAPVGPAHRRGHGETGLVPGIDQEQVRAARFATARRSSVRCPPRRSLVARRAGPWPRSPTAERPDRPGRRGFRPGSTRHRRNLAGELTVDRSAGPCAA